MTDEPEVPEHWDTKEMQEVCEITYGDGLPKRDRNGGDIPVYGSGGISGRHDESLHEGPAVILGRKGTIDEVRWEEGPFWAIDTTFYTQIDESEIVPRYLYYFFSSLDLSQYDTSSAVPSLRKGDIKKINILVPPLEEQKAIVDKLDNIFERIGKIQDAQEQAEEIQERLESIIASDIFNELDEETVKLKEVTEKITDGSHQTPDYTEDGVYFLRAGDVKENEIEWDNLKNITEEEHERLSSRWPEKGDVLYTKNGTIGIAKAVDWEKEASIYVSLALIRPTEDLDTFYLEKFLNTDLALQQAKDRTKTVSVSNLHLEEIREMEIPLPSIEKQSNIVDIVEKSHSKIRENKEFFDEREEIIDDIPKSVLTEAFNGNLVDYEADNISSSESSVEREAIETEESHADGDGQQSLGEFR